MRALLTACMAPLTLALTGCGQNIVGAWNITLWEVEGPVSDTVDDVGWIEFDGDEYSGAYPLLMRYYWSGPNGFQHYELPSVTTAAVGISDEEERTFTGQWTFEQEVIFTVTKGRDSTMVWETETYPPGSLSRWTLERQ